MGTLWNRSGTIERHADDLRAGGAKAYFFEGGTTSPLTVYEDSAEGAAHPHPVVADANGRWPDVFVPFITSYDVQVKSAGSVQLSYSVEIPNADPTVTPPTTILPEQLVATGMIHAEIIDTARTGYVRLNGRGIGNAASAATERADADTVALFTYLWFNVADTICPVSGGRGATAALDYAASKVLTLPDLRGGVLVGLDTMGNTAGSFFTGLTFLVGSETQAGSIIGTNFLALIKNNLPAVGITGVADLDGAHTHTGLTEAQNADHTHAGTTAAGSSHTHGFTGTTGVDSADHTHSYNVSGNNNQGGVQSGGALSVNSGLSATNTGTESPTHTHGITGTTDGEAAHTHTITTGVQSVDHAHTFTTVIGGAHTHTFTTADLGIATPINNLGRSTLATWYIKL